MNDRLDISLCPSLLFSKKNTQNRTYVEINKTIYVSLQMLLWNDGKTYERKAVESNFVFIMGVFTSSTLVTTAFAIVTSFLEAVGP
jgi:cytochrome c biogenesis protein CcdA